jgi:hypothetical protein
MKQDIHLVAYYFMKPKQHVHTQIKGWTANPDNFQYDEKVEIFRGLKTSAMRNAKVILNLSQTKIIKNSWNHGTSFDELFAYFYKNYSDYVTRVLAQLDPDSFKAALDSTDQQKDVNT